MKSFRVLGLKPKRFSEWLETIIEEENSASWRNWTALFWDMGKFFVTGIFIRDRHWHEKMRACYRCPVFDRTLHRCGPWTGSPLGCHCYLPLKNFWDNGPCWIKENIPQSPHGWDFSRVKPQPRCGSCQHWDRTGEGFGKCKHDELRALSSYNIGVPAKFGCVHYTARRVDHDANDENTKDDE